MSRCAVKGVDNTSRYAFHVEFVERCRVIGASAIGCARTGQFMTDDANKYDRAAEFSVFLGMLSFFSGLFCIIVPHAYAPFFDHYVGWLFLLIGGIQFVHAYSSQYGWALVCMMMLATLNIVMGGMILNNPYTDILGLVLPIAVLLTAEGLTKILLSFAFSGRAGWTWFLISGLMACLMGSLIYAGLPTTAFWVLGLLFGTNFLVTGFAAFFATLMQQRQAARDIAGTEEAEGTDDIQFDQFDQVEEELAAGEARWSETTAA